MYSKHIIVTMMLGIAFCFGTVVEAAEKPAAANTEVADQLQPAVSATPAEKQKSPPSVPAAQTENADDAAPEAFVPQKNFTFPSAMDGAKVLYDFIIQNKGGAPLNVNKVKTG